MSIAAALFPDLEGHWLPVRDTDPRLYALYRRHYSTQHLQDSPSRRALRSGGQIPSIAPFGDYMALLTSDCQAGFLWVRAPGGKWQNGSHGVSCAFFRNEGPTRSSDLILEAMDLAWERWPGERLFTYVWDAKVGTGQQKGRNAIGWCYRKAGWRVCGRNADGRLTILEILPPRPSEGTPADRLAQESTTDRRGPHGHAPAALTEEAGRGPTDPTATTSRGDGLGRDTDKQTMSGPRPSAAPANEKTPAR